MKWLFTIVIVSLWFRVVGQQNAIEDSYSNILSGLETFVSIQPTQADYSSFESFLHKLDKRKAGSRSEVEFLRYAFSKTHQVYLKRYAQQATFDGLFQNGTYNCLTGTILYALILKHAGIRHEVIETNYHIFVLAYADAETILLEATDPINGFVSVPSQIEDRIEHFRGSAQLESDNTLSYHQFSFNLYHRVTMRELQGLLFYNLAVSAFNHKRLQESVNYLNEAVARYSSARIEEFARILTLAVHESSLDNETKAACQRLLNAIRHKSAPVMAGL